MHAHSQNTYAARLLRIAAVTTLCTGSIVAAATHVRQTNLVTDDQAFLTGQGFAAATTVDPLLINPWGVSESPTGPFWVSNQVTATSTLYNTAGTKLGLTVSIPGATGAGPTGQVFYGGASLLLPNGSPGRFFFANLDGTISGWNGAAGTTAVVVATSVGSVYTGLALASVAGAPHLYAANAITGAIDVYDNSFAPVALTGNFVDPGANPYGLVPFNIQALGGKLYVTYAIAGEHQDEAALGLGFVSEFNADGTFIRRIADGGALSSPWGVAIAPTEFGQFAGALLVGNFSDTFGTINAYRLSDGSYLGSLEDLGGSTVVIPYLWALQVGNGGSGGQTDLVYFAAGIGDEMHGLFGSFGAVPEPASWGMTIVGFGVMGTALRRRRASDAAAMV